jgi:hypothetical protein
MAESRLAGPGQPQTTLHASVAPDADCHPLPQRFCWLADRRKIQFRPAKVAGHFQKVFGSGLTKVDTGAAGCRFRRAKLLPMRH